MNLLFNTENILLATLLLMPLFRNAHHRIDVKTETLKNDMPKIDRQGNPYLVIINKKVSRWVEGEKFINALSLKNEIYSR